MKHFSKFMIGALALGLWSCSSEEPLPGGGESEGTKGDFNATLTLQLPTSTGTRSTTTDDGEPAESTNGNEFGQIYENNVDEVLVVLATRGEAPNDQQFTYLTYGLSTAAVLKDEAQPTYALQFESKALGESFGETVYVFTYCNPTTAIKNYFQNGTPDATKWIDEVATINSTYASEEIWANNSFLMTNAKLSTPVTLQDSEGQSKEQFMLNHGTANTAFDLGMVEVERVAARFDFQALPAQGDVEENTYTVKDNRNGEDVATVTLLNMALFNTAKTTYYIPRVSDNGLPTGANFAYCGNERFNLVNRTGNWVVGPYATEFPVNATDKTDKSLYEALYGNYNSQLNSVNSYEELAGWTSLLNWNNRTEDNNDWTGANGTDYRIWCYAPENVSPGEWNQRQGSTTGVMFKAQLNYLPDSQNEQAIVIRESMQKGHILYAINGVIYGDVAHMALYAAVHPKSDLARAYTNSGLAALNPDIVKPTKDGGFEIDETVTPKDCETAAATAANLTVYTPDAQGNYFMYYPYYNRHNSINTNDGMNVMEYQVVRNNVYKLRVNSILRFGFADKGKNPNDPGNGTEDETPEVLFRVSCKVLPWVVRVNDIDFK